MNDEEFRDESALIYTGADTIGALVLLGAVLLIVSGGMALWMLLS